jgi:hypothetical protein
MKIMHSYTVQCAITASGKLLPAVFICQQERSGTLSLLICEEVKTFIKEILKCFRKCNKIKEAAKRDMGTVFGHSNEAICEEK